VICVLEAGRRYSEHLGDADLALLGPAVDIAPERAAAVLRNRPDLIEAALASVVTFERVFGAEDRALVQASPFLVFATAIHRSLVELNRTTFVEERVATGVRVPVFDVAKLREYADAPERRLFTIELLASYTTVASGPIWFRRGGRWRRQRFSELDPGRMAAALDLVPPAERPGVYRRLGDLALFLTGVFPEHTARRAVTPVERERLLRSVGHLAAPSARDVEELTGRADSVLRWLGPRWYALAANGSPLPVLARCLRDVAHRYEAARRFLNFVTDRCLFPMRNRLFPSPGD